jgi:hypothetical protein
MPYRVGLSLKNLIEPDHRARNVFLLVVGSMLAGSFGTLAAMHALEACPMERSASAEPREAQTTGARIDTALRPHGGMGALTVVCTPKCDLVLLDGEPFGTGLVFNRPVTSGDHVLDLRAPNGLSKQLHVHIDRDATREVRVTLSRDDDDPMSHM